MLSVLEAINLAVTVDQKYLEHFKLLEQLEPTICKPFHIPNFLISDVFYMPICLYSSFLPFFLLSPSSYLYPGLGSLSMHKRSRSICIRCA